MTSEEARGRAQNLMNTYANTVLSDAEFVSLLAVLLVCVEFEGYERGIEDAKAIVRAHREALR